MKQSTTIMCKDEKGKTLRWCMRCGLHLDEKGEIDQDYYTARQYFRLTAISPEARCSHEREVPDSKEELINKANRVILLPDFIELLKEIIQRLP